MSINVSSSPKKMLCGRDRLQRLSTQSSSVPNLNDLKKEKNNLAQNNNRDSSPLFSGSSADLKGEFPPKGDNTSSQMGGELSSPSLDSMISFSSFRNLFPFTTASQPNSGTPSPGPRQSYQFTPPESGKTKQRDDSFPKGKKPSDRIRSSVRIINLNLTSDQQREKDKSNFKKTPVTMTKGSIIYEGGMQYEGPHSLDPEAKNTGKITLVNKSEYYGHVVSDAASGSGSAKFAHNVTYNGQFQNGMPHGKGVVKINGEEDGFSKNFLYGKYVEILEHQLPSVKFSDKSSGIIYYANGYIYEGQVDNSNSNARETIIPNGIGIFKCPDGRKIKAQFERDENVKPVFENKQVSVFSFVSDKIELLFEDYGVELLFEDYGVLISQNARSQEILPNDGPIKIKYNNNDVFEGKFTKGEGHGTYTREDGTQITGSFKKGILSGDAIILFKNGSRFKGKFVGGSPLGICSYTHYDGTIISGYFQDGILTGKATVQFTNGNKFEGEFESGKAEGTYQKEDGTQIKGEFVDGNLTGKATVQFTNGDKFEGEFESGKAEGTYQKEDGTQIKGEFVNGVLTGKATIQYKNGDNFEGEFKDGTLLDNYGVMVFSNKNIFAGSFLNHKASGKGSYLCNDAENENVYNGPYVYQGYFQDGKMHGTGKIFFENGDYFDGEFKNGFPFSGNGKIIFKNGDYFVGEFKNGTPFKGNGIVTDKNGNIYHGEFKNGKMSGEGDYICTQSDHEFVYHGGFLDGKVHGRGKYIAPNSNPFEGSFEKGKFENKEVNIDFQFSFHESYGTKSTTDNNDLTLLPTIPNMSFENEFRISTNELAGSFSSKKLKKLPNVQFPNVWKDALEIIGSMDLNLKLNQVTEVQVEQLFCPPKSADYKFSFSGLPMKEAKEVLYSNGTKYTGPLKSNVPHGQKGTMTYPENGGIYEGPFANGKRVGLGRMIFKDQFSYKAEFVNDSPTNVIIKGGEFGEEARYTFGNSEGFVNNIPNSKNATLTWKDGRQYLGPIKMGKFSKDIKFIYPSIVDKDGNKYTGPIKDNTKRHGYGFVAYSDGRFYEGQFEDDKKQGLGYLKHNNGTFELQSWKNGKKCSWNVQFVIQNNNNFTVIKDIGFKTEKTYELPEEYRVLPVLAENISCSDLGARMKLLIEKIEDQAGLPWIASSISEEAILSNNDKKITKRNGDYFSGSFNVDGMPLSGTGLVTYFDGSKQNGHFKNGKFVDGTVTYLNGDYDEYKDGNIIKCKKTLKVERNQFVYEGGMFESRFHGQGTLTCLTMEGISFTGQFENGKPFTGVGAYLRIKDGAILKGKFKDGKTMLIIFPDNSQFHGTCDENNNPFCGERKTFNTDGSLASNFIYQNGEVKIMKYISETKPREPSMLQAI